MLDELKEEAIVNKVGGRFKLSTLIQKRMVALNTGARPLVDVRGGDKLTIVIQEILQDKIYLDMSGQLQTRGPSAGEAARRVAGTSEGDEQCEQPDRHRRGRGQTAGRSHGELLGLGRSPRSEPAGSAGSLCHSKSTSNSA